MIHGIEIGKPSLIYLSDANLVEKSLDDADQVSQTEVSVGHQPFHLTSNMIFRDTGHQIWYYSRGTPA